MPESNRPKPPRPGPFESLDSDLVVLKGTRGRPIPEHTRRLAIGLVMAAGRSRVAILKEELTGGLTGNQLAGALTRLASWPEDDPLAVKVEGKKVTLRPLPAKNWVRAYRWLYESALPWEVKRSVWLIRAGHFGGKDPQGRERFRLNVTGRRWPAIVDCIPQRSRGKRGRALQLRKAEAVKRLLVKLGLMEIVETSTGRGQGPSVCVLSDHSIPAAWLGGDPSERVPHSAPPAEAAGVTPRTGGSSHHGQGRRHTTDRGGVTPRNNTTPSSDLSLDPSPDPAACLAHPAELPEVGGCAADRGEQSSQAAERAGGRRAAALPPAAGGRPSPVLACRTAAPAPPPAEEAASRARPRPVGRPSPLGAPPVAGPRDGAGKATSSPAPAALEEHIPRASAASSVDRPAGKPAGLKARIREAVYEINGFGLDAVGWFPLLPSVMPLDKVVGHILRHNDDLPADWVKADLEAAFACDDLLTLRERSWGLIVQPKFWARYCAAVARIADRRRQFSLEAGERDRRAEEAAASEDPLRRTSAGAYFLRNRRPDRGLSLLYPALRSRETQEAASEAFFQWAQAGDLGGHGPEAMVRLEGALAELDEGSPAYLTVRCAIGDLRRKLGRPPIGASESPEWEEAEDDDPEVLALLGRRRWFSP